MADEGNRLTRQQLLVRWAALPSVVTIALVSALGLGLGAKAQSAPPTVPDELYAGHAEVATFVQEMVDQHGFEASALNAVFAQAQRKQKILDAISRPAERRLVWHEYRKIFLDRSRIDRGLVFWQEHEQELKAAARQYGVPPEIIVAIIGVETRYGRVTGGYRVIDALSTLAFDYPPRSAFFRSELAEFLLLTREEGRPIDSLKGSYAGAMGYGQFIPSSFRAYAVDFDGDGKRDIWANPADAIGSVGNYFKRHGWVSGDPVIERLQETVSAAETPAAAKSRLAKIAELANASLKPTLTVGQLNALGFGIANHAATTPAALFRMQQPDTAEFWLGLHNFYVITRYNHSRLYAMAVYQLSQEIAAARTATARAAVLPPSTPRVAQPAATAPKASAESFFSWELAPPPGKQHAPSASGAVE